MFLFPELIALPAPSMEFENSAMLGPVKVINARLDTVKHTCYEEGRP